VVVCRLLALVRQFPSCCCLPRHEGTESEQTTIRVHISSAPVMSALHNGLMMRRSVPAMAEKKRGAETNGRHYTAPGALSDGKSAEHCSIYSLLAPAQLFRNCA
jgi:hypothetical protein